MTEHTARYTRLCWLGLLTLQLSLSAVATEEPPVSKQPAAPVVVDGTKLFKVRGALAYPAEERAQVIGERIAEFAADRSLSTGSLRIVEAADRSQILIGDRMLTAVVDADAEFEGLSRQQVAELQRNQIVKAVERYRRDRSPEALVRAAVSTLIATVLLIVMVFGARRLVARFDAAAKRHYQAHIERLQTKTRKIVQAERLQTTIRGVFRAISTLFQLVIVLVYLEFVLAAWPWTRPLSTSALELVVDPLRYMGLAVLDAIPGFVFIAILILITRYVLAVARLFFSGIAEGSVTLANFERDWAWPTYRIVRFIVIALTVVVAYPYIPGSDSLAFKGISVFLGVLFSLGSTSMIANLVAGYSLVYRRAFKVGDRVRIGEHVGVITAMRVQATHLRSLKNEDIVIPNSLVLNSSTINYSTLASQHGLILHTTVGIGYETPWRQVEAMLVEAAHRTPDLLREPPPFVRQKGLGDFAVSYELNVYCDQPHQSERLYTALHRNILDVFNEYGVQIMTPAYEGDPAQPKVVARDNWYLPPSSPPPAKTDP